MDINNHGSSLQPIIPIPKLKYNEIGVRSDLKGFEIKNLIDKIIFFLIYKKYPNVILKSRAKGTSKLIAIIDILKRKILGLYVKEKIYSTSYTNNKEPNKEIKLPCMDAILTLKEIEGFTPPRNINELETNYIDPKNPPDFRNIRGNNNINLNNNNLRRGRGKGFNIMGFRPGFRGRGLRGNRGIRGIRGIRGNRGNRGNRGYRGRGGFNNNHSHNNYNNSNFNSNNYGNFNNNNNYYN